jgi:hypothetical protein
MRRSTLAAIALCWAPWLVVGQPVDVETGLSPFPLELGLPAPQPRTEPPGPEREAEQRARIGRLLEGRLGPNQADAFQVLRWLAIETTEDPDARYVLLRMAIDAGIATGDLPGALRLVDLVAAEYRVDGPALRTGLVCRALESASAEQTPPTPKTTAAVRAVVETLLLDDRTDLAESLLAAALEAEGPEGAAELRVWSRLASEWDAAMQPAQAAALRLAQHRRDPDASLAVGRYLCCTKGDWDAGLPMLAEGGDPAIRQAALDDLRRSHSPAAAIAAADGWRALAAQSEGLAAWRLRGRADRILRELYPSLTGLRRIEAEERMDSRPLFIFGPHTNADETWKREHLHLWANHDREGPGSWADVYHKGGRFELVANRAGYVQTLDTLPPEGVERYRIEASLASDLLHGTALEFCGQRMNTTPDGIALQRGWKPEQRHPLDTGFHDYLIEGRPEGISFTVDGEFLGTMPVDEPERGPLVLRGWEGHVRCRRLEFWAVPDESLAGYVRSRLALGALD